MAIDGKTSRRSHNKKTGKGKVHLVAYATNSRLVLAQEAVDEKENEIVVIPKLLDQLDLDGALVSIDAIACNPAIAEAIVAAADYLLQVRRTSRRSGPRRSYFASAPRQDSTSPRASTKPMAGWRFAPTRSPGRSAGWLRIAPFRAPNASPGWPSSA